MKREKTIYNIVNMGVNIKQYLVPYKVYIKTLLLMMLLAIQIGQCDAKIQNKTIVTDIIGFEYTGMILQASDSILLLWQSSKPYNKDVLSNFARKFFYSDIKQINIENKGKIQKGLGYGLLSGGASGAAIGWVVDHNAYSGILGLCCLGGIGTVTGTIVGIAQPRYKTYVIDGKYEKYYASLIKLRQYAIFPSKIPSELEAFFIKESTELVRTESIPQSESQESAKPIFPVRRRSYKIFHLTAGGAVTVSLARENMVDAFGQSGFGGGEFPIGTNDLLAADINAEFNITQDVRLGFAYNTIPVQKVEGINGEYEIGKGKSYCIYATYLIPMVSQLFTTEVDPIIGAGLCYNVISIKGALVDDDFFLVEKNMVGAYLKGAIDYYLIKNLSFHFQSDLKLIPSFYISSKSNFDQQNAINKTLNAHKINFSSLSFSFGIGFHL